MIRKIHSLRPVPFPSLSIYSSAQNSIDITCTSTNKNPSKNVGTSTTASSSPKNSASTASFHQQHMVRMIGGAATAISSLKKKDPSGLVHNVIAKQKNNFIFNTFISLDALATPPPNQQREEFEHSSRGGRPPLKKKEGLKYPTIEISQKKIQRHHHAQHSNVRGENEPRERIWFDILPLPYNSSFGIVEKNVNFFLPEYESPFQLHFIDQEEGTRKKVVCFPTAVALRERSSGVVFLGGTSSCLQVFTFPHLNLPLLFFPPSPSSLSAPENPDPSNSGKNRFEFTDGKSKESSGDLWADAVEKTEPSVMPPSNIQESFISDELTSNNKLRVPRKKHSVYLAHLTNHVRLVDATAERIANHFFATNENLLKYSGNSKLVCVSNAFLDVHEHEESLLPSSVIVKDGFDALRQVRVICAALQEALQFVRSELKNIETEVNFKFVADDLARKRSQHPSTRNHAPPGSKDVGEDNRKNKNVVFEGEEDEIRKMRAMLDARLAQDVISLWETAFCRVLDAHIRERGSMVSLLNILTMSNRLPHTRSKDDDKNTETSRKKNRKIVVGKEGEEVEIDERKLLPRASSEEMKLADMTLFAQLIKSWTQL